MPPTPRRTPRKLNFGVIEETPGAKTNTNRVCVLAEKSAKRWIPALVPSKPPRATTPVEVLFADGTHSRVVYNTCRALVLNNGATVRVKEDSHTYTVVRTLKTEEKAQFSLENGHNVVELVSRRGGRTIKALIKSLFFHDASSFPTMDMRAPTSKSPSHPRKNGTSISARTKASVLENGSPLPVARRMGSVIYNSSVEAPISRGNIFSGCVFVVTDDLVLDIKQQAINHKATVVDLLSDLFDVSDMSDIEYNGPSDAKFFAVLGSTISPTSQFLEALSLGWPCLSNAFIHDCISQDKFLPWQDYLLGLVSSSGFIKSQNCFEFEKQWQMSYSLAEQFKFRHVILGDIITPLYVRNSLSSDVLLLVSLACANVNIVRNKTQIPAGCIFIDTDGLFRDFPSELKSQMCRQVRLPEVVTLSAQWLLQCILNQKLV